MSFITHLQHSFSGKEERPCYITYVTCPFATWVVEKEREKIEQKKREKIEQKKAREDRQLSITRNSSLNDTFWNLEEVARTPQQSS